MDDIEDPDEVRDLEYTHTHTHAERLNDPLQQHSGVQVQEKQRKMVILI